MNRRALWNLELSSCLICIHENSTIIKRLGWEYDSSKIEVVEKHILREEFDFPYIYIASNCTTTDVIFLCKGWRVEKHFFDIFLIILNTCFNDRIKFHRVRNVSRVLKVYPTASILYQQGYIFKGYYFEKTDQ